MFWNLIHALLPSFWLATSKKRSDVRDVIISAANVVVGLNASDPESLPAFRKLLGSPPKGSEWDLLRPFHIDEHGHTTGLSTCGLVTRGIHVAAGIRWPEWYQPYVSGRVFTDMTSFAMKRGLWRTSGLPKEGDAFVIGTGHQTHMATAVNVDGFEVLSVDGGQVDEKTNLQCVRLRSRDFRQVHLQGIINVDGLFSLLK